MYAAGEKMKQAVRGGISTGGMMKTGRMVFRWRRKGEFRQYGGELR
jgi:hypothetical protein